MKPILSAILLTLVFLAGPSTAFAVKDVQSVIDEETLRISSNRWLIQKTQQELDDIKRQLSKNPQDAYLQTRDKELQTKIKNLWRDIEVRFSRIKKLTGSAVTAPAVTAPAPMSTAPTTNNKGLKMSDWILLYDEDRMEYIRLAMDYFQKQGGYFYNSPKFYIDLLDGLAADPAHLDEYLGICLMELFNQNEPQNSHITNVLLRSVNRQS